MNDHLRRVAKNAPPRPRSSDAISSSVTCCGVIARAVFRARYPPAPSYSASVVVGFARTILRISGATELLDDPGGVVRLHAQPVLPVDGDDRPPPATPEAFDSTERAL